MENLNFSFETLKTDLQTNCLKIDFLLKNFNEILDEYTNDYLNDENCMFIQKLNSINYENVISKNANNFILPIERISNLVEVYYLSSEILNNFYDYIKNFEFYFINEFYQNIILLFEELNFRSIYNLIVFNYFEMNNRFDFVNKSIYNSFFDYSNNFINKEL